jgi:hypothetical protein
VAAGAGRDLALADAAAVDLLAQGDGVLVLREARLDLLRAHEPGDVAHVFSDSAEASGFMMALLRLPDLKSCSCLRMYSGCCCASLGFAAMAELPSALWHEAQLWLLAGVALNNVSPLAGSGLAALAGAAAGRSRMLIGCKTRAGCKAHEGCKQNIGKQLHIGGFEFIGAKPHDSTMWV